MIHGFVPLPDRRPLPTVSREEVEDLLPDLMGWSWWRYEPWGVWIRCAPAWGHPPWIICISVGIPILPSGDTMRRRVVAWLANVENHLHYGVDYRKPGLARTRTRNWPNTVRRLVNDARNRPQLLTGGQFPSGNWPESWSEWGTKDFMTTPYYDGQPPANPG